MARISFGMRVAGLPVSEVVLREGARRVAAIEAGMQGVTAGVVLELRQDIGRAFPRSARLPTTITGVAAKAGRGLPPAALVFPRRGSNINLLLEGQLGATITPRRGKALAIPLRGVPRVGDGRTRPMTPEQYRARFGSDSLIFIPPKPGQKVLGYLASKRVAGRDYPKAAQRGRRARKPKSYQILYALVAQVALPARLAPQPIIERWVDLAPYYIAQAENQVGEVA